MKFLIYVGNTRAPNLPGIFPKNAIQSILQIVSENRLSALFSKMLLSNFCFFAIGYMILRKCQILNNSQEKLIEG